jgi:hypothetical protein
MDIHPRLTTPAEAHERPAVVLEALRDVLRAGLLLDELGDCVACSAPAVDGSGASTLHRAWCPWRRALDLVDPLRELSRAGYARRRAVGAGDANWWNRP